MAHSKPWRRLFGLFCPRMFAQSHTRAAAVLVDEFDAKPLIRNFSGTAWLGKNLPEINGRLQDRLKWSTGAPGLHPPTLDLARASPF
jgi:hypothetical protein